MKKYKIAIMTAFIGNAGNTGELKITPEAQTEFDNYGVDLYRFNNDNLDQLLPYVRPTLSEEEVLRMSSCDRCMYWWYEKVKYKQKHCPKKEDDYTRLVAKIPKMMFYKVVPSNYDYYVWLDSKFTIYEHWLDYLLWLINKYPKHDVITSKHSARSSVEAETKDMLIGLKEGRPGLRTKYYGPDLAFQLYKYHQAHGFDDDCLNELTMIVYSSHMLGKTQFGEEWYAHNCHYTIQDQLSFPFLCQKHHIKVASVCQDVFNMPFVTHEYGSSFHK